jgi:hypothetical protein
MKAFETMKTGMSSVAFPTRISNFSHKTISSNQTFEMLSFNTIIFVFIYQIQLRPGLPSSPLSPTAPFLPGEHRGQSSPRGPGTPGIPSGPSPPGIPLINNN